MEEDVQRLVACTYEDLPKHTKVINSINFEYYLWVELPDYIDETYSFFQIEEVLPNHLNLVLDEQSERIQRYRLKWIKIIFAVLGRRYGQHIYRVRFIDKEEDVISLYFSYIVQDDCPIRPYIYMPRRKRCCCRHECNICQ